MAPGLQMLTIVTLYANAMGPFSWIVKLWWWMIFSFSSDDDHGPDTLTCAGFELPSSGHTNVNEGAR